MDAYIENIWTMLNIEQDLFFFLKKIMICCLDVQMTSYPDGSKSLGIDMQEMQTEIKGSSRGNKLKSSDDMVFKRVQDLNQPVLTVGVFQLVYCLEVGIEVKSTQDVVQ